MRASDQQGIDRSSGNQAGMGVHSGPVDEIVDVNERQRRRRGITGQR